MLVWLIVAGVWVLCGAVVLVLFFSATRSDPYPTAAAGFDEHTDGALKVARSAPFTGAEDTPMVVAGSDIDSSLLLGELYEAMAAYRRGELIETDAPKEAV